MKILKDLKINNESKKINASEVALVSNNKYKTLDNAIGDLSDLNTSDKSSVVNSLNEVTNKILWTNSNLYQNFAAQTVTLSEAIENFKYYTVIYHLATDGDVCFSNTGISGKGMRTTFAAGNRLNWRGIDSISGTQCVFTDSMELNTYGDQTQTVNSRCIPVVIIGHYN